GWCGTALTSSRPTRSTRRTTRTAARAAASRIRAGTGTDRSSSWRGPGTTRNTRSKASRKMGSLAAPDKFRGTLTAGEAPRAIEDGAGPRCQMLPLADGGEGTLDALGGANRGKLVTGPLGRAVEAGWRLEAGPPLIWAARAPGLAVPGRRAPRLRPRARGWTRPERSRERNDRGDRRADRRRPRRRCPRGDRGGRRVGDDRRRARRRRGA